jgi:hypothetical protein
MRFATAAHTSLLSPLAAPFYPKTTGLEFSTIYYNGEPAGIFSGSHIEHEVIKNIPDEAIDELFPPNAEDAAELDDTDEFIKTLVDISFLEDLEEKARSSFSHIKKRWESRREEGLKGKPHRLTHSEIQNLSRLINGRPMMTNEYENALVMKNLRDHLTQTSDKRTRRSRHVMMKHQHLKHEKMHLPGHIRPLQQPRKVN